MMKHRKDVQILRGLAVLLVVLFHLDVDSFRSGFLGVDVFFVISGYLMAAMYRPEEKVEFFKRRARRLLPAYFAVVISTMLVALVRTIPTDFNQVVTQAWFAVFAIPNIGYWLENSYFDKSTFKPLLHLWSLGVELQFYLLIPAVYWLLLRAKVWGYGLLAAASAIACFYIAGVSPKTSFFLLPFRMWEFLIGHAVARYLACRPGFPEHPWIGAVCLAAILLIPMMPVDGSTPGFISGHPGLISLLIAAATATVLLYSLPQWIQTNHIAGWLERIGNWSYSIYLAHFPVIVLVLYEPFSGTLLAPRSLQQAILVVVGISACATALFLLVEQPFRHRTLKNKWIVGGAVMGIFLAVAGAWVQHSLLPKDERAIYAAWDDRSTYRCGKLNRILSPRSRTCDLTGPMANPSSRILLVGNSHADSIKDVFAAAAQARGASLHFLVENNPLMSGGMSAEMLMKEAIGLRADSLVFHYSAGAVPRREIAKIMDLAKQNGVKVAWLLPVPVWDRHVPRMLWSAVKNGEPLSRQSIEDHRLNMGVFAADFADASTRGLRLYDVAPELCRPDCLLRDQSGAVLYFDRSHLTLSGSTLLLPLFERVVDDLLQQRRT